jgi:predicted phage terminase large subunit-like protein
MATATTNRAEQEAHLSDDAELIKAERNLFSRSLVDFIRGTWNDELGCWEGGAWHALPTEGSKLIWNWHLDLICSALERVTAGEIQNLAINIPPGHMKSLIVSVFWPAWEWTRFPGHQFLSSSHNQDNTKRDCMRTRDLIKSEWYQARWGASVQVRRDHDGKTDFGLTEGAFYKAGSVSGGATGKRADRLIVDDALSAMGSKSEKVRKSCHEWWRSEFEDRVNDEANCARVVIGQRLHEADLSGLLEDLGGFEWIVLPTEFAPDDQRSTVVEDPRTEEGELLFPQRFDAEHNEKSKVILGPYDYAAQHDQTPVPAEGGILHKEWFRYWVKSASEADSLPDINNEPIHEDQWTLKPSFWDRCILSVDCSFKKTDDGSFVAIQLWGQSGPDCYLIDQVCKRMSFTETLTAIKGMLGVWPMIDGVLVEDKANGEAVMDVLRAKLPNVVPASPGGKDKEVRVHAISYMVRAGSVYLPNPNRHTWIGGFLKEATTFPKGKHDDQVDAMSQALLELRQGSQELLIDTIGM